MTRRLPSNVVSPTEFGQRREQKLARQIGADRHPASGAGRTKGDMTTMDNSVVELKTVPLAKSHTVKLETLYETLRQAESRGGEAYYVVEFNGITLTGRVHRS